ncbi:cohesin subunit SA-2-like isoform X2 [Dromiciops gliroides]|uniref:cohesin subunit SA-2-like isoform X2 n=1 Tax=Dromiciops gliroides TaxID=33562 RepID=UPI001CC4DCCC|nr:cohesin subunit SA-2-like isoform X2 [Dromiciops gliroides]
MIAEPSPAPDTSQKENDGQEATAPASAVQNGGCVKNPSNLTPKGRRKVREQCENVRKKNISRRKRASQPETNDDEVEEVVEAVTLFEVVSLGKRAMQSVVDDWIEAYKEDRDLALLDLINFFIQCSGCQGMVTAEMYQSLHTSDILKKMIEKFDEETGLQYKRIMARPWILTVTWPMELEDEGYPLVKPGPHWKKFKANFCEFTAVLIQQCQYSILYDGYLMNTITSLLSGLTGSVVRAFRHTSTLAAVKLVTALVSVIQNLDVSIHNAQQLYEVEKNRTPEGETGPRLDELDRKRKECQQKPVEIENMMNALFKGTFVQRYRDVIPEIRIVCIEEMGSWLKLYPNMFLNDSYLKYLGWMLYDKQAEVRLKCLQGLRGLYEHKELIFKMGLFNTRFKSRIVSMTTDKEPEVAVEAMKLVMLMVLHCENTVSSEECEAMYHFVYATYRPLAVVAGELLCKRLFCLPPGEEETPHSKKKNKFVYSVGRLKKLITFFLNHGFHKHVTYLVDSLWDWEDGLLRDWECLTNLLRDKPMRKEEAFTDAQENVLVEIIAAAVRQTAEGHPPVGRGGRKVLSAKEKKTHMEECIRMTERFIVVLPELLAKYSSDIEKVTNFLQIPQYYNLNVYVIGRLEKYLDALLKEMKELVHRHTDLNILEACSKVYSILCNDQLAIYPIVSQALHQLIDEMVKDFSQLLNDFFQEEEGFGVNEEHILRLSCILKKLTAFHNAHDLTSWHIGDWTLKILNFEKENGGLPAETLIPALQCSYFALLWQLELATEALIAETPPSQEWLSGCGREDRPWEMKEALSELKERMTCFRLICESYLNHHNKDVSEKAFILLCDLLIVLSHQGVDEGEDFTVLKFLPDHDLQSRMIEFVKDHVFGENNLPEETNKEETHSLDSIYRKRIILAEYCKLIAYNVVEMMTAVEIYKHYMQTYHEFGDIIKETINRTRHNDKIESARTLIVCLQELYQNHMATYCNNNSHKKHIDSSASFANIKELARRFSLTFGWDQMNSRESIAMIHKEGIDFAFHGDSQHIDYYLPPNLTFLAIISEFSNKLLKPDKKLVYYYLQEFVTDHMLLTCKGENWHPLYCYRSSLIGTDDDAESTIASSFREWPPPDRSKVFASKRKFSDGSVMDISLPGSSRQPVDSQSDSPLSYFSWKSKTVTSEENTWGMRSPEVQDTARMEDSPESLPEEQTEDLSEDIDVLETDEGNL